MRAIQKADVQTGLGAHVRRGIIDEDIKITGPGKVVHTPLRPSCTDLEDADRHEKMSLRKPVGKGNYNTETRLSASRWATDTVSRWRRPDLSPAKRCTARGRREWMAQEHSLAAGRVKREGRR